jgi:four helix bundle protein
MRRCAASIPANIAEGCGRVGDGEFARFLQMAMGSASEFEYHILLAHDLTFLPAETYKQLHNTIVEIKRMLSSLIMKVNRDRNSC